MPTLEALARQIESTEGLESVVRTMKSLSAVHIRQYERAVTAVRRYHRAVELGLHAVLRGRRVVELARRGRTPAVRTGIVAFGSDYGLCGQFNEELTTRTLEALERLETEPDQRLVACVGARAAAALRARGRPLDWEFPGPSSVGGIEGCARRLLLAIDDWRAEGRVERLLLVHHQHRGSPADRLQTTQLLPIELSRFRHLEERPWPSRRIPVFTMDPERLLASLLRELLAVAVFRAFAESAASEHASRLRSMQAAERSIADKLDELRAELRRRRQETITAELLDIVSGYEALAGPEAV